MDVLGILCTNKLPINLKKTQSRTCRRNILWINIGQTFKIIFNKCFVPRKFLFLKIMREMSNSINPYILIFKPNLCNKHGIFFWKPVKAIKGKFTGEIYNLPFD